MILPSRSTAIVLAAHQAALILVALIASLPAMIATGYLVAWAANLHGFRRRSLVERVFWSIPLSFAVTPIAVVLLAKAFSLTAAAAFLAVAAAVCLALLARGYALHKKTGLHPLGGWALAMAAAWVVIALLSLVDFESGHRLYLSTTLYDHSYRVSWTQAILRSGVPPANPLYRFGRPAPMRTFYFWYVVCAATARLWRLPARWVFDASCIWAGFALAALIGLYLKHFLAVGERLRRQFLVAVALLAVTGLDLLGIYWEVALHNMPLPPDLEWWSRGQVASWFSSLLWVPHHVAALVCCMFAFLLAWIAPTQTQRQRAVSALLISLALASGFGLSIFVVFAFALLMVIWAVWHLLSERTLPPVATMAAGGALALLLLAPYLQELRHEPSGNSSNHVFSLAVREMIPPEALMHSWIFAATAATHPLLARNLANLALLAPGYLLELGFFLVVLSIFLVPKWRARQRLSSPQRTLLVIAVAALILISVLRSWVLETNDFGWRAALFVQFPLLLLGSELMVGWQRKDAPPTRRWLRVAMACTLWIGAFGTTCQALVLRFYMPFAAAHDAATRQWVRNAWVSRAGYADLDRAIPRGAVVQYNPHGIGLFGVQEDLLDVDRQTAMFSGRFQCGSLWGGDPSGCTEMSAALQALFAGGSAEMARATCRRFGIDDLVVRAGDTAWQDPKSWVWTLPPVVSQDAFRALLCR